MAAMSDYLEAQLLNLIFRTQVAWKPTAIYFGLFTVAPTDAGGGTEVTGGAYARVQVTQLDGNWTAPGVAGLTDNVADITFATATASWGTVTNVGIFDAATAGNLLFHGALASNKVVDNGDTFKFALGAIGITLG